MTTSTLTCADTWREPVVGKSEFARDALKRQLAIARFKDIRSRVAPFAEAEGWLTDEDVFEDLS